MNPRQFRREQAARQNANPYAAADARERKCARRRLRAAGAGVRELEAAQCIVNARNRDLALPIQPGARALQPLTIDEALAIVRAPARITLKGPARFEPVKAGDKRVRRTLAGLFRNLFTPRPIPTPDGVAMAAPRRSNG